MANHFIHTIQFKPQQNLSPARELLPFPRIKKKQRTPKPSLASVLQPRPTSFPSLPRSTATQAPASSPPRQSATIHCSTLLAAPASPLHEYREIRLGQFQSLKRWMPHQHLVKHLCQRIQVQCRLRSFAREQFGGNKAGLLMSRCWILERRKAESGCSE